MKDDTKRGPGLLLLLALCGYQAVPAFAEDGGATNAEVYRIDRFAGDDDGYSPVKPYEAFYRAHRRLTRRGLLIPLPEELSASGDSEGHWGALVDDLQLSVRFHRREFLAGEPVSAMVLLRNLAPTPRQLFVRNFNDSRKNFAYVLHHGTNALTRSWTDPKPPDPIIGGYAPAKRGYPNTTPP
ncbi:MAG: hypothetical protein DME25_07290, partial [Verrucomicrobia bacterium]